MQLHRSIAAIVATATVLLMFAAVVGLQPVLAALGTQARIAAGLGSLVVSVGIYTTLLKLLLWLFTHWRWLRKQILGRAFLEGTWVGHYEVAGEHRFTIEIISQKSGTPFIRGREFDSNGRTRASWRSHTVTIEQESMRLIYAYTCEVFELNHAQEGLGVFSILCEGGRWPTKLDGYATDLTDGQRDPNTEFKVSDGEIPDLDALANAREIFLSRTVE